MKFRIVIVLADDSHLSFDDVQDRDFGLFRLDDVYTLTAGYKLYKLKGNVLCGEEVEYKKLLIKISK